MGEADTELRAILQLAANALYYARRSEWEAATKTVRAISDEHGGEGLMLAIVGWCDTLAAKHPAVQEGASMRLAWADADNGGVQMAHEVPECTRWAGRVVMARAALDKPTFDALMDALPHDGWEVGRYVGALLQSVALTLNRIRDDTAPQGSDPQ